MKEWERFSPDHKFFQTNGKIVTQQQSGGKPNSQKAFCIPRQNGFAVSP